MPVSDFTAGDVLTAANLNMLPRGLMAIATATTAQNTISATTDVTSLSVTWTAVANRRYRISVVIPSISQVSTAGYWSAYITDGSNVVKQQSQGYLGGSEDGFVVMELVESSLSAGSTTRKARIGTSGGTLNLNAVGTRYIVVEDIGKV